jgi:hypothetical protein
MFSRPIEEKVEKEKTVFLGFFSGRNPCVKKATTQLPPVSPPGIESVCSEQAATRPWI